MLIHRLFGKIEKVQEQSDGTLIVDGICSSESVDSQGEIVKASAMAAALPDYMKFANVREMHQAIAAGKALACHVDEAGITHITAHVVDAGSVKKVQTGVLQGFSIGGTVPPGGRSKDNAKVIEAITLSEISLVDRPANPDSVISFFKADVPVEEAKPAAEVKKGMYTVAWAAELCQTLANLASETQWEADYEGDESPIPARIKALCAEFAAILRDLVAEETAELIGDAAETDAIAMAEKPGALKKSEKLGAFARAFIAGAKGEQASKSQTLTAEDFRKQLDAALKLVQPAEPAADIVTKLADATAKLAELEKRTTDAETATAAAGEALKKVMDERDRLTAELATKGSLKVVPVAKEDDGKTEKDAEFEKLDPVEQTKMIHAGGGRRIA